VVVIPQCLKVSMLYCTLAQHDCSSKAFAMPKALDGDMQAGEGRRTELLQWLCANLAADMALLLSTSKAELYLLVSGLQQATLPASRGGIHFN